MRKLGTVRSAWLVVAALVAALAGLLPPQAAQAGSRTGLVALGAGLRTEPAAVQAVSARRGASSLLNPALFGVAATSASDVWAVGQFQTQAGPLRTLIEHWNGTAWARVPSPNPVSGGDVLNGVTAISASNAWAVGGKNGQPLILHWTGTAWRQVPSRALPGGGVLAGVAATSAADIWAVDFGGPGSGHIVIEHWNGTAWTSATGPVLAGNLFGVAATSATDAWAVGFSGNDNSSSALTMHWNGTKWTRVPNPNPAGGGELLGVAASSASDAWAVSGAAQQQIGVNKSVIDHWDGKKWTRVPSANPVPGGAILLGVAATSVSNAWAVGIDADFVTSFENVIEHWNGSTWTLSHSPVRDGDLNAVAATSASNAWAVGSTTGNLALIEHWNGTSWTATTFH